MKLPVLLISLLALTACGKTWRSKVEPSDKASKAAPGQLDQWSGRSDYTDDRWQIKSQP